MNALIGATAIDRKIFVFCTLAYGEGANFAYGNTKRKRKKCSVDEGRKRVMLIAASILAARKLAQYDPVRGVPSDDECDSGRDSMG